jgi:hypothetical protein
MSKLKQNRTKKTCDKTKGYKYINLKCSITKHANFYYAGLEVTIKKIEDTYFMNKDLKDSFVM